MTDGPSVALLIVGDEILRGRVQDTNLKYLAKSLSSVGIKISKVEILPDNCKEIANGVKQASSYHKVVFTSGGVGPTHDDVTYQGVAEAFGLTLTKHQELFDFLKKQFPNDPVALRLAKVPSPCELVYISSSDPKEKFAVVKVCNVYVLPGSPQYFTRAVDEIVPKLEGGCLFYSDKVEIALDEFSLVEILDNLVKKWSATVAIGSYPQYSNGSCKTKSTIITFEGEREAVVTCKMQLTYSISPELLKSVDEFDWAHINDVYSSINEIPCTKSALEIINKCYDKYAANEVFVSFNGGKDCTAVLHLVSCVAFRRHLGPIVCLYITGDSFPEVDEFVQKAAHYYGVILVKKPGPIKTALTEILKERPCLKACFMGVRKGDPGSETQDFFTPTDPHWPSIMRVNAILNWSYQEVWAFLLRHKVPYCSLYDQGYTSIGRMSSTIKNPKLKDPNDPNKYMPAHSLKDDSAERHGRE